MKNQLTPPLPEKLTRQEHLSSLMDYSTHFIHHYLGKRRGQGRVLRMLNEHGAITQQELQCLLGVQSGSLSELLAKLESSGFIRRERDESDKRRVIVSITPEGIEDLRQHEAVRLRRQAVLYDCLDPEEQEEMVRILSKLQKTWEELPPPNEHYHTCQKKEDSKP